MLFIFLALITISYVHAATTFGVSQSVLITCNTGCGCVTETGVAVSCPFIKSSQTAVMRATKTRSGQFAVGRIAQVESDGTDFEGGLSSQSFCPTTAGDPANDQTLCDPIDSSKIPKAPVRVLEDPEENIQPEIVEHFISPIGTLSLSVTRQSSGCSVVFARNLNHLDTGDVRHQLLDSCGLSLGSKRPEPTTPEPTNSETASPEPRKISSFGDRCRVVPVRVSN